MSDAMFVKGANVVPLPPGNVVSGAQRRKQNEDVRDWKEQRSKLWNALYVAGGMIVLLGASLMWEAAQSKVAVVQVTRDGNGSVLSVHPVEVNARPTDANIAFDLTTFIENTRTIMPLWEVSTAPKIKAAYVMVEKGSQAERELNDYYQNDDPFEKSKKFYVIPGNITALPDARDTSGQVQEWSLQWDETPYSLKDNMPLEVTHWRARVSFTAGNRPNVEVLPKNPDRLLISFFKPKKVTR